MHQNPMHRFLAVTLIATTFAATVALATTAATADAASRHKRHQHQDRGMWAAQSSMRPVGPPWASPNQCFTDEGYGRYSSCDSSRR